MTAKIEKLKSTQFGFTLVEVMVALVVGIISMVVVLQTFSASEASKRTATGGDDAQMAGALGLFQIERDMNEAGYGVNSTGIIGCSVTLNAAGGGNTVTLAPVIINPATTVIPAGDAGSDTLLISYGNTQGPAEGDVILNPNPTPTTYKMQSSTGWTKGDYVIAAQNPPQVPNITQQCSGLKLDTIATVPSGASTNVVVTTGVAAVGNSTYVLYDLGQAPVIVGYAVRNGSLTSCNYIVADCSKPVNWSEVAGNIASLRAVYGHNSNGGSPMTGTVDTWDATPPAKMCDWYRTLAVSVVLVARNNTLTINSQNSNNGSFAGATVTSTAPVWQEPIWAAGTLNGSSTVKSITIDLSGNAGLVSGTTWQNYRYKLYQTVVPLHNMTWMIDWVRANTTC